MKRSPQSSSMRSILTPQLRFLIVILSVVTGIFLTALYFLLLQSDRAIEEIRTIMFVVLSIDSIFFSFSLKDLNRPLWKINIFSNWYLIFAMSASTAALLLALFVPALQKLLSLTPVSWSMLLFAVMVGLFNLFIIEVVKSLYIKSGEFRRKN